MSPIKRASGLLAVLFFATVACTSSGSTQAAAIAPAYRPADCAHVPTPKAVTTPTPLTTPSNKPIPTSTQLRIMDNMLEIVDRWYLYPDFQGRDWHGVFDSYRSQVAAGVSSDTFYDDMDKLVTAFGDNHSQFESPRVVGASDSQLAGVNDYVGIGVVVLPLPAKGRDAILDVFPGSTAEHAGLKAHDSILAVDGRPIVQKGVVRQELIRGPRCSTVVLTVQSPGKASRKLAVVRDRVTASEPIDARLVTTKDHSRIGYIFIPTFYDVTVPGQVERALRDFGHLDGLVLDNRMNPGGASSVAEPILSDFTSGTLGQFIGRGTLRTFTVPAHEIGNSQEVPLVVMVGKGTVSFGELFSGILQDVGRARIVGENSAGNVELLHGWDFTDGSRLWLAEERFDPVNSHANWEGIGVTPNVKAVADWDTFTFATDPGVAAALKLLGHH